MSMCYKKVMWLLSTKTKQEQQFQHQMNWKKVSKQEQLTIQRQKMLRNQEFKQQTAKYINWKRPKQIPPQKLVK